MILAGAILGLVLLGAPKPGDVAPDFTATDSLGQSIKLSDLLKKGPVILAFFPKSSTSGWRKEFTAYRSRYADLQGKDAQLLAVSTDSAEDQNKFKEELKAPFPFIPDTEKKLVKLYGIGTMFGFAERTTIVIGADSKVVNVQTGGDAIDPNGAITSCPLHRPHAADPAPAQSSAPAQTAPAQPAKPAK